MSTVFEVNRMVPNSKDSRGYRKTSRLFSRLPTTPLPPFDMDGGADGGRRDKRKLGKRGSLFHLGSATASSPDTLEDGAWSPLITETPDSPQSKRDLLQKSKSSSVFGSLGKKSGNSMVEKSMDSADTTPASSIHEISH